MNFKKTCLTVLLLSLGSASVSAGSIICSGKVEELSYHADNRFMIRLEDMNLSVFFCSPDAEWTVEGTSNTTGPETCKTLYSTFLAAKMSGQPINALYLDGDDVPSSCNGWAHWKSANIRHFNF